jgi:hypothetical protein
MMQIFLSWSGERSRAIAEALRAWLPKVVQSVKPWMSDEDIDAGSRWLTEVTTILSNAKVGLICVTPENQHNPWLLFEAGALSRTFEQTCVCPILFSMTPGQLSGPLTQFQANVLSREGIGKILATINRGLGERQIESSELNEILDVWWPKLQEKIDAMPHVAEPVVIRSTESQLDELLSLARENMRRENLRLEASRERDEKTDGLLDFMEKAGAMLGNAQQQSQNLHSLISRQPEASISAGGLGMTSLTIDAQQIGTAANGLIAAVGPGAIDIETLTSFTGQLREMQVRDKERTAEMLLPPPPSCPATDGSNGSAAS